MNNFVLPIDDEDLIDFYDDKKSQVQIETPHSLKISTESNEIENIKTTEIGG